MKFIFKELVDVETLQQLTDELYAVTGIPSAIIAMDGEILTGSGWQRICTDFHRRHPEIEKECIESDITLHAKLDAGDAFVLYECPHGLTDASVPVIIEGEHLANVFAGQLFTKAPTVATEQFFREQARRFGLDEEAYIDAFREVPVFSEERFRQALAFLSTMAQVVASLGLGRLRELETMAELREEKSRYRIVADNTHDWEFWVDPEGRVNYVSPSCERVTGHPAQEFEADSELMMRIIHPEDRQLYLSHAPTVADTHEPGEVAFRILRPDGEVRWIEHACVPVFAEDGRFLGVRGSNRDISEWKLEEEALRESEERLSDLAEQSRTIVWESDAEGLYTYVSHVAEQVLGYRPDELTGEKHVYDLHPADGRAAFRAAVFEAIARQEPFVGWENPRQAKDGHVVWVSSHGKPVLDANGGLLGYRGADTDITERRQAEEDLRRANAFLDSIIENIPNMLFLKDAKDLRFVRFNRAGEDLLGYSQADLLGKNDYDLFPKEQADFFTEKDRQVLGGNEIVDVSDEPLQTRDQGVRILHTRKVPILNARGEPEYLLGIAVDITERKRLEQERLDLEHQLQQSQKLESLGVLAGGIAHDFNNILMVVLGNAELALSELSPSAPARENLLEITSASRRAADLCRQMLAYSGRGHFVIEPISLSALTRDMLGLLKSSISKKAVLTLHLEETLPPMEGDASQLSQVIMNLILNASEAIGDQDGIIAISTGVLECSREYLGEIHADRDLSPGLYVSLEVSDTGSGMDAKTQARLFEPFFSTKFTGRGLGLAAVQGIVRGHRGAIKLESDPDRGTTFTVLFPVAEAEGGLPAPKSVGATDYRHDRGTVLLVDDEATIRRVGRRMLERLGFTVLCAADGAEALQLYRDHGPQISLVLLDLTMPHMDGEETLRELRLLDPEACVVLSSGYTEQDITVRFAGTGLAGFVQKPYTLSEFGERLQAALDGWATSGGSVE